jgi:hypothetical protein
MLTVIPSKKEKKNKVIVYSILSFLLWDFSISILGVYIFKKKKKKKQTLKKKNPIKLGKTFSMQLL